LAGTETIAVLILLESNNADKYFLPTLLSSSTVTL
jgi:hypothetical protein